MGTVNSEMNGLWLHKSQLEALALALGLGLG